MLDLWRNYVDVFRKLIAHGFIVVKRKNSCLYKWVYPYTNCPHKYKIKEAHEILDYALRSDNTFGSTRNITFHCVLHGDII